ncbi:UNVERIFIED_CONTAM: hypothetical protein Scaly_2841100 [Sesamum calycinum]|uniref:Uncharacterized protein n=1 Tax=Sesamum calycinum TaxID=2727403 RepID=A0AAW2IRD5_9LAMI
MLYWKDDVDLEYCKFCGDARYKLSRGRDLYQKKSPYAVLSTIGRRAALTATDRFPEHHPYRTNKRAFTKNRVENKIACPRLTGDQILNQVAHISPAVEMRCHYLMAMGKTKDNMNARRDLKIICNRQELEMDEHRPNVMPKAVYTLAMEQKRGVCEWIRGLKFPEGYASNLAPCFDIMELRMHGIKSHDCHVFMQKLILIVFHEMLPEHI